MTEAEFIAALRRLPLHPGARGLADDAALVAGLTITTDTMVEGVHWLPGTPAGDVAWKLVASNLSDLGAKGATPVAATLNYPLGDDAWDRAFLAGLAAALAALDCPLAGGDTVTLPPRAPRILTLTAFGTAPAMPSRRGARPGDALWVTGTIGDAGAGLALARDGATVGPLVAAHRRPRPLLAEGRLLAAAVRAMMDVSDGLLIDAARLAAASDAAVTIDLAAIALSPALVAHAGDDRAARLAAATAGDDYQLLFALSPGTRPPVPATRVGRFTAGAGLTLTDGDAPVPLPERLGWLHGGKAG